MSPCAVKQILICSIKIASNKFNVRPIVPNIKLTHWTLSSMNFRIINTKYWRNTKLVPFITNLLLTINYTSILNLTPKLFLQKLVLKSIHTLYSGCAFSIAFSHNKVLKGHLAAVKLRKSVSFSTARWRESSLFEL